MTELQRDGPIDSADLWDAERAYDFAAAQYDDWHWQKVWRAAERDFIDKALRTHHSPLSILDVGCGTGTLLGRIYESSLGKAGLVGIDISRGMLKRAHEKFANTPIEFIHEDFLRWRSHDRSFDVIFMCRVASHIADLGSCFRKIASLLRPGGTLVFSDVYSGHPYECTRLPLSGGKISVMTYKHQLSEVVKTAYECSLILTSFKTCSVESLPPDLRSDPDLPRTLLEQLEGGPAVPFGCLMTFALRT